ncbi:glycosyltransferase [Bacteroidota bacterium]
MKQIIVSVTNDLTTDQRVHKICTTLHEEGYSILVIGRKLKSSLPLKRDYKISRMRLLFSKGFLFYAEYNLRLFIKLLFLKKNILIANDLDTLLPNYLISKIFNLKLVYDSHELFTEVPELIHRPRIQKVWCAIENFIFPKLKNVYTVNNIIADIYSDKYKVPVKIIRNIAPKLKNKVPNKQLSSKIKGNKKMLILQGAGINVDRGAEEAVEMMQYLENTILYIIGSGDVFPLLNKKVKTLKLEQKVFLLGRKPYAELMEYTKIADLGLSLDKNTNLNYEYSLPNKIFDYIQAEIPLLVSDRRIIANIVEKNNIGVVTKTHNPKELATIISEILSSTEKMKTWKNNVKLAAEKYNWETESKKLIDIYKNIQ